jgi:hypothetical protein
MCEPHVLPSIGHNPWKRIKYRAWRHCVGVLFGLDAEATVNRRVQRETTRAPV